MSAQEKAPLVADSAGYVNEVRLRGRLAADPDLRQLPSGDSVWCLRLVVGRLAQGPGDRQSRQRVDSLECAVWSGSLRRRVGGWKAGDVVEVSGQLHRRFFRAGGTTVSRVEVVLSRGRLTRRAASG